MIKIIFQYKNNYFIMDLLKIDQFLYTKKKKNVTLNWLF